ncbi:MAG: DUF5060 domain-containing protein [Planctomycetota bacterium]
MKSEIFRKLRNAVLFLAAVSASGCGTPAVPLYGLFETEVVNKTCYDNPFAEVELKAEFVSPSGKKVDFFGFYDGDGKGGQNGCIWKQRFMPDEVGLWRYTLCFTDGSPAKDGQFQCVAKGARPGPWRQHPDNPHWFKTASAEHFLPLAMFANCLFAPINWQDAIGWCKERQYNTLIVSTFNTWVWAKEWENVLAFVTTDASKKEMDYERLNLKMWHQWDQMIQTAAENGIYIGPFNGPKGTYGGRRGKYPPVELAYWPKISQGWDAPFNIRLIRYLVARQGAYWNLAFWNLCNTEMYHHLDEEQAIRYGEYFASVTPFGRMITAQDIEQWHNKDRRWLSKMDFPSSRKLNTVQTSVGTLGNPGVGAHIDDANWQEAYPNNQLALDSYNNFTILTTEGLWEGQGRAKQPLRIIWGFLTAGAHVMWADWSYDEGIEGHRYGSIGRGWVPVRPLNEHLFRVDQLGVDCVGDEQLKIAVDYLSGVEYWKMNPNNQLVAGSTEAYCLAQPGRRYTVYAPKGGMVKLDLSRAKGTFSARWLDPRLGGFSQSITIRGGKWANFETPDQKDWVLDVALNK